MSQLNSCILFLISSVVLFSMCVAVTPRRGFCVPFVAVLVFSFAFSNFIHAKQICKNFRFVNDFEFSDKLLSSVERFFFPYALS